jgi:T4 RnlA family RNA ligase
MILYYNIMMDSLHKFYLPTYQECQQIVASNDCFYEKKIIVDGFNVSVFNYRMAELKDFLEPIPGQLTQALELRGLTFIHSDSGATRFLMLHKFFNLNQVEGYQYHQIKDLAILNIQDKMDGSMIRFVRLPNGKVVAKTKNDFTNDQTRMSMELYNQDVNFQKFILETLDSGLSAIFELTSFMNQIVVRYDSTELTLLQLRDEKTGEYLDIYSNDLVKKHKVKIVRKEEMALSLDDYIEMAKTREGIEGWIFSVLGGMFKLKTAHYMSLHGLLTNYLVKEDHLVSLILNEELDDALALVGENDPRRSYALSIRSVLLSYFKKQETDVSLLVEDFYILNKNKKDWAMKYKSNPLFPFAASLVGRENWKDEIYSVLKKHVLKVTYRLMEAQTFLRDHGLVTKVLEIGDDDS